MTEGEDDPIRTLLLGTPTNPTGVGHTLGVKKLADVTGTHYMTVLAWINKGELRAYKFGKEWTIITEDAIAFLQSKSNQAPTDRPSPDTSDEPASAESPRRDSPPDSLE